MLRRIDNFDDFVTGDLQTDSLNYLCLSEESRAATLNQIANDLVQLHRIQEEEDKSGVTRTGYSEAEAIFSIQQIAKDLVELQKKLADMGKHYTLSFLERYYKTVSEKQSLRASELTEPKKSFSSFSSMSIKSMRSIKSAKNISNHLSHLEQQILTSEKPVTIDENDMITVNGQTGIWVNKAQVSEWKGDLSLDAYSINNDDDPEVIYKDTDEVIEYVQELAVRYLKPNTPEPPGDVIITQEPDFQAAPAPPIIIRQNPKRPETPETLVIREAPPTPPTNLGKKIIKIAGKQLPPPPRKVIIERLAALPAKPQSVIIERWLPYPSQKRKVIFEKSADKSEQSKKEKNLIIQWQEPRVQIKKEFKYLGSIKMEPDIYKNTYGNELTLTKDLPDVVNEFETPEGLVLAADQPDNLIAELEGDLHALRLIDLKKENLEQYSHYIRSVSQLSAVSS